MSGVFGSSAKSSTTKPDYTGLQIQTSVSTLPIPFVRGRTKLAANLIDYDNFQTHAQQSSTQTGKGGGSTSTTSYTYTAAIVMALCGGPISAIGTIWQDQSTTTLADLGLTLFTGAAAQAAWGWMQTYHPEKALAYPGLAYLAASDFGLGSSAALAQHNFEIIAALAGTGANGVDADPAQVAQDFLYHPQEGIGFPAASVDLPSLLGASGDASYQTYCRASGLCFSPCLTSQESGTSILQRWMQITNSNVVFSGSKLKFVPLCNEPVTGNGVTYQPKTTPEYDLDDTDFVFEDGEEPVQISISDPADAYNVERLEICDRSNAYNTVPVEARVQGAIEQNGERIDTGVSAHEICDSAVAQIAGQLIVQRNVYIRRTFQWKLSWEYCLLEPGDWVTLTRPAQHLDHQAVRIKKATEDETGILSFVAEELPAGVATATAYPKQGINPYTVNRAVAAKPVNPPVIFEPPLGLAGKAQIWIGASGGVKGVADPNWGGAQVWVSVDTEAATYDRVGAVKAPARQGALTAPLPAYAGDGADTVNSLSVDLSESGGVLANATQDDADAGRTLCWVDGEILAYATATLTGSSKYTLTYLDRGLYGTTAGAHAAGALFLRLDSTLFKYDLPEQYVGKPLHIKLPSFNVWELGNEGLDEAIAYTLTPTGAGYTLAPPSGVTVNQVVTSSSLGMRVDLNLAWVASTDAWTDDYEMTYSVNGGTPTTLTTGGAVTAVIEDCIDGAYDIEVRATGLGLRSDPATITYTVDVANLALAAVTGLELQGQGNDTEFVGRDAVFDWRLNSAYGSSEALGSETGANAGQMDAWFKDFVVSVYDTATGALLRTETGITEPSYTYDFAKNVADGGPRRSFRIEVVWRDNASRVSAAASLTVSNPPPGMPTNVTLDAAFKNVFVNWVNATDLDFAGTLAWMSTTSGFKPSDATKVYDGPNTGVAVPADTGVTYYVVLASYDAFGEYQLQYSAEMAITTKSLQVQDISDGIIGKSKLNADLSTTIDKLDPTNLADPNSVASQIKAVTDLLSKDVTALNTQISQVSSSTSAAINAAVIQESGARTSADNALAAQITTLTATVGGNTSSIQSESLARSTADSSLAQQISALSASVGSNLAVIQNQLTATAGTASAAATSVSTLQSTVGQATASIQTLQQSINGISAESVIKTDVNGYIAGYGLYNTGITSQFIVRADTFAIGSPGTQKILPFVVQSGVVYIDGAQILHASIGSAQIGSLAVDTANIKDLSVNGQKIGNNAVSSRSTATGTAPTAYLVTQGNPVLIIVSSLTIQSTSAASGDTSTDSPAYIQAIVDGVVIASTTAPYTPSAGGSVSTVCSLAAGTHAFSASAHGNQCSIYVQELTK